MFKISITQEEVEDFENFNNDFEKAFDVKIPFSYEVFGQSMVGAILLIDDPQLIYIFAFAYGKHKQHILEPKCHTF